MSSLKDDGPKRAKLLSYLLGRSLYPNYSEIGKKYVLRSVIKFLETVLTGLAHGKRSEQDLVKNAVKITRTALSRYLRSGGSEARSPEPLAELLAMNNRAVPLPDLPSTSSSSSLRVGTSSPEPDRRPATAEPATSDKDASEGEGEDAEEEEEVPLTRKRKHQAARTGKGKRQKRSVATAFSVYSSVMREAEEEQHPEYSAASIRRRLTAGWKALSKKEKDAYEAIAESKRKLAH